jgi:hypothetical protein
MLNQEFYDKWCKNCLEDINKDSEPTCEILNQALNKDIRDINNKHLIAVGNYVIECKKYKRS